MKGSLADRLLAKREIVGDDWLFCGATDRDGYGRIGYQGVNTPAHRAAWIAFRGDPGELHVLHSESCGSRRCFNPDHLHLGDHPLNMRERDTWGNGIRGERVSGARLTSAQVIEATGLRQDGATWVALGHRYGVSSSTVRHAVTGRSWRHLERK